jgi:hypothetical protein
MGQCSRMRDLSAADGAYLAGGNCHHRSSLSSERDKLDLVSLVPRIDVHNGSDITGLKALLAHWRRQYHSVMLANHA